MSRRPEILDFLRAEGLTVIEVNGWRTRGSESFDPRGSVNHHTAGAAKGNAPSLRIVTEGRGTPGTKDYLPPPLCQVLQARDDTCYLIAAGRANHAGAGGWKGLSGNSSVWGLEVEHVGTAAEPFPSHRYETTIKIHTAFARCSKFRAEMVAQHYEWAGPRKSDFFKGEIDPNRFRSDIASRLAGHAVAPSTPATPPQEALDMGMALSPSWGTIKPNGRTEFFHLVKADARAFNVISYNDARLDRVDGIYSNLWFLHQDETTGAPIAIIEKSGAILVLCEGGGVYKVADIKSAGRPK